MEAERGEKGRKERLGYSDRRIRKGKKEMRRKKKIEKWGKKKGENNNRT